MRVRTVAKDARRVRIVDDPHPCGCCRLGQGGPVLNSHAADQPLSLVLREAHREARCLGGSLSRRQDDLGDAAAQETAEVELRFSAELLELEAPQLAEGLALGELARNQPAKDIPQSPASTSRMRCQCVPAQ